MTEMRRAFTQRAAPIGRQFRERPPIEFEARPVAEFLYSLTPLSM